VTFNLFTNSFEKKRLWLCGRWTQKLLGGKAAVTLLKLMWFLGNSPEQAVVNDYRTQTAWFANCKGRGAKISGKDATASALWELGSTEMDVQRVCFKLL